MTIPIAINYEALTTAIREDIIGTYQAESLLGLFPSVAIPKGISAEKWAQKYIIETKRAALHHRGFNPNSITMDFKGFEVTPITIDQKAVLDEISQAQFAETGLLEKFVPEIGFNMAYTSNTWIMSHKGGNDEAAPFTEYHYILADGDGANGTAAQPLWLYDAATAGAWSTLTNAFADLATLKGNFIAKGGNFASSLLLVPKAFAPAIEEVRSEYQNKTLGNYLDMMGFRWMYVEDHFFQTQAGATPVIAAGDIVLIDTTEFVVGYQRPERVISGQGSYPDRNFYIEGEVWFAFLCVPFRKNEAGTIKTYKSAARIRAINAS